MYNSIANHPFLHNVAAMGGSWPNCKKYYGIFVGIGIKKGRVESKSGNEISQTCIQFVRGGKFSTHHLSQGGEKN